MSDPPKSTPPTRLMKSSAPETEEEDRIATGSHGVGRPKASANTSSPAAVESEPEILEEDRLRASVNAKISAAASEPSTAGIDNRQEATSSHPQQTSPPHHYVPQQEGGKETFLNVPQPSGATANFNHNYDDNNYDTRFPPDPIYQEASDNARVYRVYMEESKKYDAYMTDEAREGLDVLLVFAGLFSAVLTTFVAQTSQSLQPDRATESTLLLREIAALQRAQMNGTSADSVPSVTADFTPSAIDVWVNGLWFTSLMLSLAVALFAVVIKQWIRQYMSLTSGTPRHRSLIRQFRFMGLQKWHVPALVGILPVLMHLSLAMFLIGLTLFLVPLRHSIASIVGSASVLVFVADISTAAWPLVHIQCPYRTPLASIIHWFFFIFRKYVLRNHDFVYRTLQDEEHQHNDDIDLEAHAFFWLLSNSVNPSVRHIVEQAIGGLSHQSGSILDTLCSQSLLGQALECTSVNMFSDCFSQSPTGPLIRIESADLLEQLLRALLHRQNWYFLWELHKNVAAIQSFSAPTLGWEATATAFMWRSASATAFWWQSHHGLAEMPKHVIDECPIVAKKACILLGRIISEPHNSQTQLLPVVWENLLEAASSHPMIVIPDQPDLIHDTRVLKELKRRVCWHKHGRSDQHDKKMFPISFEEAMCTSKHFVWSLLWPFDNHREDPLDSEQVQQLISLVNAISLHGLVKGSRDIVLGTWKQITRNLHVGSVTRKDQDAICVAANTFLRQRTMIQTMFGRTAVLLPSLSLLHCCTSTSHSGRSDSVLALLEIEIFECIRLHRWTLRTAATVTFLTASVIRTSLLETFPPEWLEYISFPKHGAVIVSLITYQGSTSTPASVAQVRDDLWLFFDSQSHWEHEILQTCKASLEDYLQVLVPYDCRDDYRPNMKEARRILDEVIAKQSPKPANCDMLGRLLRRSRQSTDAEAATR